MSRNSKIQLNFFLNSNYLLIPILQINFAFKEKFKIGFQTGEFKKREFTLRFKTDLQNPT